MNRVLLAAVAVLGLVLAGCYVPTRTAMLKGETVAQAENHELNLIPFSLRKVDGKWEAWISSLAEKPSAEQWADGFTFFANTKDPCNSRPKSFHLVQLDVSRDKKTVLFRRFKETPTFPLTEADAAAANENWIPAGIDLSKENAPELETGTYVIRVRYEVDGKEYTAAFTVVYKHGIGIERGWQMPVC